MAKINYKFQELEDDIELTKTTFGNIVVTEKSLKDSLELSKQELQQYKKEDDQKTDFSVDAVISREQKISELQSKITATKKAIKNVESKRAELLQNNTKIHLLSYSARSDYEKYITDQLKPTFDKLNALLDEANQEVEQINVVYKTADNEYKDFHKRISAIIGNDNDGWKFMPLIGWSFGYKKYELTDFIKK